MDWEGTPGAAPGDKGCCKVLTRALSTGPAGWQLTSMAGSIGTDPDPGYRQVTVPTLPQSGSAPSSESRGKAGHSPPVHFGDLPVAAQISSFPPGKYTALFLKSG